MHNRRDHDECKHRQKKCERHHRHHDCHKRKKCESKKPWCPPVRRSGCK